MAWSLYGKEEYLEPLKFSNGKTQEDVVNEVVESIDKGKKVIFIHGKCGTGKSAIALNIAKELGKTSIVVPGKNLQQQYKKDYENDLYLLKNNNERLNISVITGRNNHKCKFLQDKGHLPQVKKEKNMSLQDIFANKEENNNEEDKTADNTQLPCKIEIKENNMEKIKEYLKQNNKVNPKNFEKVSDVKRMSIAPVCPYWSPVFPEEYDINLEANKERYMGLNDTEFIFYKRKQGCSFYEQFHSYIHSDVIVFNSLKYNLETAINRKPLTEAEIIDECDEFLDSFSNQRNINIDRLEKSLNQMFPTEEKNFNDLQELKEILHHMRRDSKIEESKNQNKILRLKETGVFDLFLFLLKNKDFLEEVDEENYAFDVEKTAKMFEEFLEETYVTFEERNDNLIANVVTTNLSKKFQEMLNKNKVLILMSGTLHSKNVLRDVFGISDFEVIDAETKNQGKAEIKRTGLEKDCKYSNFFNGNHSRRNYLEALDKCVGEAKKPCVVHVNGFKDMPDETEIQMYDVENLISKNRLRELQIEDKDGRRVSEFKQGNFNVLFTTRDSRGIDFPGEECNSIIFTKYPNPDVKDPFWQILNKTKPLQYWKFYKDKAMREILQKAYRGLRSEDDYIEILSPDSRVLDFFEKEIKS